MKTRLVIDENTVYEIDEDCLSKRRSEERMNCNNMDDKQNNSCNMNSRNRSNYSNRLYNSR